MAFGRTAGEPTSEEFEEHLAAAEHLLAGCDRLRQRAAATRVASTATVVLLLPVTIAIAVAARTDAVGLSIALAAWIVAAVIVPWATGRMVTSAGREQLIRDTEAMSQITDLLSDVLPVVAERDQWTHVRVRVVQSRLARFPVGAEDK